MKKYLIAVGIIAAAYLGYNFYQKKQSIDNVDFDIVDVDLLGLNIKVLFTNIGNSTLNVTAVENKIYVDNSFIGTANRLSSFSIEKTANTTVEFKLTPSILGGVNALAGLFKTGGAMPKIRVETTINANGILFNKTTNI